MLIANQAKVQREPTFLKPPDFPHKDTFIQVRKRQILNHSASAFSENHDGSMFKKIPITQ